MKLAYMRGLSPDEAASRWLVRRDAGWPDPSEEAQFEAWLADSAVNTEAFARCERTWALFDQADGDPNLNALRESALAGGAEPKRGVWVAVAMGVAASLLAVVGLGVTTLSGWGPAKVEQAAVQSPARAQVQPGSRAVAAASPGRGDFATAIGERRTIELADGSSVTLNTGSAIQVAFTTQKRFIGLLRGQALFTVAKDHNRPFVVQAGDREVTALGTVFQVRLDPNLTQVTLVEGKVVVDQIVNEAGKGRAGVAPTVLYPGHELSVGLGIKQLLKRVDVDRQLLWREGFVEFDDVPLSTAVEEMNRYSSHLIIFRDPQIAKLRVSGIFRTGSPERFASIVAEVLPVSSRRLKDGHMELVSSR
jgi:transmembrane sensor